MAYEEWNAAVQAVVDEAHLDNIGGNHREGFCKACADALTVVQLAVPGGPDIKNQRKLRQHTLSTFTGDSMHPDWADYVATNLGHALDQVKDSGDWYGAVQMWCRTWSTGRIKSNAGS